jgi:ribose transport system substrate-binding protein
MTRIGQGLLIGLAALGLVSGCNRQAPGDGDAPRVAFVMKTLNHPFFLDMQRGAEEAASAAGLQVVVQAAEREMDVEKQMQIIENLLQTGIQVLIVTPSGSKEIASAIAKANAANVPVIVVDTRVDADVAARNALRIESFIGSDNYEGGQVAGRYLVEATGGTAQVAILEGIPGHETGDSRLRGFRDAIGQAPGMTIVASQPANWERDQGFSVVQNMLQARPGIDALFACNDLMALGALEAVAAAGRAGRIRIVGFDALDDARRAIDAGRMDASVAQSPHEMGRVAIESAARLLRGESLPAEQAVNISLVTRDTQPASGQ